MGCLGWFLIVAGIIGIFIGGPVGFIGILIGIAVLAFGASTNKTKEAVEKTAEISQKQNIEQKKKEIWVAERMNELLTEGLSISDAKAKADMEYTLNNKDAK